MNIEAKLQELGLTLPPPPNPVGSYLPVVRTGNLLMLSGQIPMRDGKPVSVGKTPSQASIDQAHAAARQCILNALAVIGAQIDGDWSRLKRIVRLGVFVQSDDDFFEQPKVANAASDLLAQLFGEAGRHARSAVGVNALPLNVTVEIDLVVEVSGG